jgi:hypothetical protein
MIKGSCDFYAINSYTGQLAATVSGGSAACAADISNPHYPECAESLTSYPDGFPTGPDADIDVSWVYNTPYAIREFLNVITEDLFSSIPAIVVSKFGFAESFEGSQATPSQEDPHRTAYYQAFLNSILAAKVDDDVNVIGAFAWAPYDNLEWFEGERGVADFDIIDEEVELNTDCPWGVKILLCDDKKSVDDVDVIEKRVECTRHQQLYTCDNSQGIEVVDGLSCPHQPKRRYMCDHKRTSEASALPPCSSLPTRRWTCDSGSSFEEPDHLELRAVNYMCTRGKGSTCSRADKGTLVEKRGVAYMCNHKRDTACSRVVERDADVSYMCTRKRGSTCSRSAEGIRVEQRGVAYMCNHKRDTACSRIVNREPAMANSDYMCHRKRGGDCS